MSGLAVPSIAITKKETDFSNFGNIILLMPQDVVNPKKTPVYTRDVWTAVFPIHTVGTAKKRVGALEDIKNTLNKAGLKEDIMAKVLLSEDAYEKAYKPTVEALMQSNGNVQEAARDSALIYARMIDSLARNYKLPVENIVATIQVTNEGPEHRTELHSPVNPDVKADTLVTVVDLTKYFPDKPIDRKDMLKFVKKELVDKLMEITADKKAVISLPRSNKRAKHVANSSLFDILNKPWNKDWNQRHQASVRGIKELIRNSVLIETEPNRKSDKKSGIAHYHHFYLPVKIKDKLYTVRIVGEELDGSKGATPIDVKLYDVIIKNKAHPLKKTTERRLSSKDAPLQITIAEMLMNVKDSNHQPFVNKDGRLAVNKNIKSSKAGNEHDNNESNYFQKGGQYKGGYSPESNAIHLFAAADQFTIMLCVYPLSYSSAASSGDGYTIQPVGQPMTITMQLTQWNKLKQDLIAQENDLTQLKQKLKQLKSTSSEQMQLLENLQSELNATRQNLTNANASLIECRNELEKSKASLETLKVQIKAMEHKQVVMRRQRDAYAFGFALSVASLLK